jgi:MFS family permease
VECKHVSPAAVAAILAAGDITITLLEVPTGRFADRFGHRCSLVVGSVIQTIAMLLCWRGEGIPGLVAASLCVALGDTFRSGADQALLYESCMAIGEPRRFQEIEARAHTLELIGLVAMMLAGGVIVETAGFAAAWIAEASLAACGIGVALRMAAPPPTPLPDDDGRRPRTRPSLALMRLIMPAGLIAGAAIATVFMAQTAEHATATQLTALVTVVTLAEAAGAAASRHLRPDVATQYGLLAAAASCVVTATLAPGVFLTSVVALSFLIGVAEPLRATAIQVLVDERRAEAASWASAVDGAVRTLSLLVAGIVRRR